MTTIKQKRHLSGFSDSSINDKVYRDDVEVENMDADLNLLLASDDKTGTDTPSANHFSENNNRPLSGLLTVSESIIPGSLRSK